ncbi:pyridoxal phosphate-dependent transferase [Powellomyces hirtus]|nr:pyridoxal phosphate-dependent transferase [Powellomyces hirtus]
MRDADTTTPVKFTDSLSKALSKRRAQKLLRTTPVPASGLVDFSSNDYLGLATSGNLKEVFLERLTAAHRGDNVQTGPGVSPMALGATGSRLLSGNSVQALELERFLADYHNAPSALLFNSGYDANLSLLSTLPEPQNGAIVYDEYVHASMHDGIKLGRAGYRRAFKHNDVEDLARILDELLSPPPSSPSIETLVTASAKPKCKTVVVAVESLYSMDGDMAPLTEIVQLLATYGGRAVLIVDEAHSTGTIGPGGRGLVSALGLENQVFARLHTFGKAVGAHGAVVLGPPVLRDYLVNYARPLVYSTMTSPHALVAIACAFEHLLQHADVLQKRLSTLVQTFRREVGILPDGSYLLPSNTMIQGIVFPGNANVVTLCTLIQSRGFDVRPIRSPTVPIGTERVRVCLHANNTPEQIAALAVAVRWALSQMRAVASAPRMHPRL